MRDKPSWSQEEASCAIVPRPWARGIRCNGHFGTSANDKTRGPVYFRHNRQISKTYLGNPVIKNHCATGVSIFFSHWVVPYGTPAFLLADNGPQFVSKLFEMLCSFLGVKHLSITACHPQTSGQAERYNKTIVGRLCHYFAGHQRNSDLFVQ